VVSFPSVVFSVVIDRFNDERLRRKEQALCAAYLSLKNRELQEMIASAIFENTNNSAQAPDRSFVSETKERTRTFEVQHIYRTKYANFVSGMGHYDLDIDAEVQSQFGSFADNEDGFRNNLYLYMQLNPILPNLRMELGISYDRMEDIGVSRSQVNPKVGLIWNPFNGTTVRAAAFKVVSRAFTANRTIEPTVVAGFNQFFDDLNGTIAKRAGFAIDQKFSERIYGGIEVSGRNLSRVPFITVGEFDWNERNARAYLYWTPYDWFATAIEYQYERFNRLFEHRGPEDIIDVETHKVPVSLGLFHPSGLSAGITMTYVNQKGSFVDVNETPIDGDDQFLIVDASLRYRLPRRLGIFGIQVRNLLDEDFNFQETSLAMPSIAWERIILGSWILAF
jgi:hypothetical protein